MRDKESVLDEIFNSDSLGLLKVLPKSSPARNADERLLASFQEIVDFYERNNNQEPTPNPCNIAEYQLYARLKDIRKNEEKILALALVDKYNLLQSAKQEINSIDDIFSDNTFDLKREFPDMQGFSETNLKYCKMFYNYCLIRPQPEDKLALKKVPSLGTNFQWS